VNTRDMAKVVAIILSEKTTKDMNSSNPDINNKYKLFIGTARWQRR